jgi:hypothetical protein
VGARGDGGGQQVGGHGGVAEECRRWSAGAGGVVGRDEQLGQRGSGRIGGGGR